MNNFSVLRPFASAFLSFCFFCFILTTWLQPQSVFAVEQIADPFTPEQHRIFPKKKWKTRPAASVCRQPEYLDDFTRAVGGSGVIIKDGYLIKTWGDPAQRGMWASATKPVFSTLLLFALHEGKITGLDDKVSQFIPELRGKDQEITFRHLANMTSGYARRESPGTAYSYNDYAIKLYHIALFGKVYSEFDPNVILMDNKRLGALQFQDGKVFEKVGNYGFFVHTSPRDFARIGWLWLNRGNWNGKQLLPESFFDQYMKPQVPASLPVSSKAGRDYLGIGTYGGGANQSTFGPGLYGMNWWFNPEKKLWPSAPEDTFQANGHWSKETVTVIPGMGIVIAGIGDFGLFQPGAGIADTIMGYIVKGCEE